MFSRYYDFYKPGDYVLYRNLERFFEVRSLLLLLFFIYLFLIKKAFETAGWRVLSDIWTKDATNFNWY